MISWRAGLALAISLDLAGCAFTAGDGWRARFAAPEGSAGSPPRLRLAVDESGDVIIAGAGEFGVAKLSGAMGSTLWSRNLGSTAGGSGALVLADGVDPVVAASRPLLDSDRGALGFAVMRLEGASGRELWHHPTLQGQLDNGMVTTLTLDPRGEVIAASHSGDADSNEFSLIKLTAADGRELWRYRVRQAWATRHDATAVTTTDGGDALVAGSLWGGPDEPQLGVAKVDGLDGIEMWQSSLQAGRAGTPSGPALSTRVTSLDRSGDLIAAWLVSVAGNGTLLVVARMDGTNGAPRWVEVFPRDDGVALDLRRDLRGNIVLATATTTGFSVSKLASSNGGQIWQRTFDAGPRCGEGVAVAVNADDDVIAAGCGEATELTVLKLRGKDGRSLWQRGLGTAAGLAGEVRTLAVDREGHVLAAGYVRSAERNELVVVKLRGSDGRAPPERATESP